MINRTVESKNELDDDKIVYSGDKRVKL